MLSVPRAFETNYLAWASWKRSAIKPFGNIQTLILMVIHTCLADLLLRKPSKDSSSRLPTSKSYSFSGVPVSTWFSQLSKRVLLSKKKKELLLRR
ncbi:hypothetical protein LIER_06970 [Lithospermum erythrorhizon]|uniref:Uncharacterized protein n=1 Tax=Lithospermum erythrorhizon TaxID=34254 RepID=A0AAV3P6C2_LITER